MTFGLADYTFTDNVLRLAAGMSYIVPTLYDLVLASETLTYC